MTPIDSSTSSSPSTALSPDSSREEPSEQDPRDRLRSALLAMSPTDRKRLTRVLAPRIVEPYVPHMPYPPQAAFLWFNGREAFYGGAAGGGKSDALLMAALQYVDVPGYSALILRKTWGDLSLPGAIMDRANDWLADTPAESVKGGRQWVFPSGARLTFGYLQHANQVNRYRSAEFQFIGVDELTQFVERTYTFLFSRIRRPAVPCSACHRPMEKGWVEASANVFTDSWHHRKPEDEETCSGGAPDVRAIRQYPASTEDGTTIFEVPLRMRSASNPGDVGHGWVKKRFVEPDTREPGTIFVPAKISDNPSLDEDEYAENLRSMSSAVDVERLLEGDWEVVDEGAMMQRHDFRFIDKGGVPARARLVRYWDLAATEQKRGKDPDFTAGALVGIHEGVTYIIDVRRKRLAPPGVERLVRGTAEEDGRKVPVWIEQEPGASGKSTISSFQRNVLPGFSCRGNPPTGSKSERARPFASAVGAGNVYVVRGAWNRAFLDEAELFPIVDHDDQVDAVSGALFVLTQKMTRLLV